MVYTVVQSFEPTFPPELWNIYQWTHDNMPKTNNSIEGCHNAIQSSVINMHARIWKLIPCLTKEEILVEKEKE